MTERAGPPIGPRDLPSNCQSDHPIPHSRGSFPHHTTTWYPVTPFFPAHHRDARCFFSPLGIKTSLGQAPVIGKDRLCQGVFTSMITVVEKEHDLACPYFN